MFETIKKIFFTEDVPARKTGEVPVGQADENQDTKNMSEPVISFIKTLENEPKRFKLKVKKNFIADESKTYAITFRYEFELLDNKTKEIFKAHGAYLGVSCLYSTWEETHAFKPYPWLTNYEWSFVHKAILNYFESKKAKLMNLKDERYEKTAQRERKRLTEIYCKE